MDPKAKEFLDHSDRFYRRTGERVIRFGFGKHMDEDITQHTDHLAWILRQPEQPGDVRAMAEQGLSSAVAMSRHPPRMPDGA